MMKRGTASEDVSQKKKNKYQEGVGISEKSLREAMESKEDPSSTSKPSGVKIGVRGAQHLWGMSQVCFRTRK